jgi:hypothetical protein
VGDDQLVLARDCGQRRRCHADVAALRGRVERLAAAQQRVAAERATTRITTSAP